MEISEKKLSIRPVRASDYDWIAVFLIEQWGSVKVISRGNLHYANTLPGLVAAIDEQPAGLATYSIENDQCELVTLNSMVPEQGIGTDLLNIVVAIAREKRCKRVWLITTNDNTAALRFYQKRGFHLKAIYPDAIERSRKLKPEIPLSGIDGIPIKDEIELELLL